MNSFYNKILSIGLSFFVLFSTSSFSVELHYCCDTLVDIGVFVQAETCSSKSQMSGLISCEDSYESCCHDNQFNKIGHDDLKKSFNDYFSAVPKIFISNYIPSFNRFLELKKKPTTHKDYRPPLLFRDFTILHETFLI